jgi:hypothetical protein
VEFAPEFSGFAITKKNSPRLAPQPAAKSIASFPAQSRAPVEKTLSPAFS